jgi:predicted nuclease with TOPRIM domain
MSEFINKAKIADLQHANAELSEEILTLKIELEDLNDEVTRLREENPDDIDHLKEKLLAYEQREKEFKERLLTISEGVKNNPKKYDVVKGLLAIFQGTETDIVEDAIDSYYKRKWRPRVVTFFLLGILVSIISWISFMLIVKDELFSNLIHQLILIFEWISVYE